MSPFRMFPSGWKGSPSAVNNTGIDSNTGIEVWSAKVPSLS